MIKGWSMFDAALSWLERGAELLPCQPASKRLVAGFGPYLQRITSADDARAWFEARRCNLALACGERFTVLDFDAAPQYAAWVELHPEAAASYTEQTRRGFIPTDALHNKIALTTDCKSFNDVSDILLAIKFKFVGAGAD